MLCIVCSRPIPIPIYRDEHKLCKSCASQIKLKDNFMNDICTDADLESVQRQLLHDLNLEEDSDYEAELNYLREAKRNSELINVLKTSWRKDKNVQPFGSVDSLKDCPPMEKLKIKTDVLDKECASGFPNEGNIRDEPVPKNFHNFKFDHTHLIKDDQKRQQTGDCDQPTKDRVNRRVAINRDINYTLTLVKKVDENSVQNLDGTFSVACRALYRPTNKHEEPGPQFEKIPSIEKQTTDTTKCETIPTGNRNPFVCPVTFCKNIIPVSDLIKHFKLNHIRVPIIPVTTDACTNLLWETKVDQFGSSQCLMLLLINRKCNSAGDGHFTDCLPVAIMTTKVKLSDLVEVECHYDDDAHFYLIWLTAMTSSLEPVDYTITAWGGMDDGRVHVVNTTQSYSVRADQNPKIVYRSGMVMILSSDQIRKLSNDNQDMVKLQVVVH